VRTPSSTSRATAATTPSPTSPPGTDKLDLSQLLQGENGTTASLDDYLHFIDLAGVNLASHYGVTPGAGGVVAGGHDTATIISGMLNDHSLKVDTV
jgi:hypothetical protein